MTVVRAEDTKVVYGVTLRRDPAREPSYQILHLHRDLEALDLDVETRKRERIYRDRNSEVQTLEIAAQCLVDFPEAPWDLRLELARQCWDEARHAALLDRPLRAAGSWKGEFPIANLDWSVVCMLDSLPA